MTYLTDRRGDLRADPKSLLPSAQSIVCVGKLYKHADQGDGSIARYACGDDYHDTIRAGLEDFVERLRQATTEPFESRICVDTAPLLERSLARLAGLGWIGKNTCLINQERGSWFLLGEVLLSLSLDPGAPPPDRCGTCRRCIDACPTDALIPDDSGRFQLDSRLCISYLTIEKRGEIAPELESKIGAHVFGCDICQDVCPWNRNDTSPAWLASSLVGLSNLTASDFRQRYRKTAVWRSKYAGFLRNVAIAMGNSNDPEVTEPLRRLAAYEDQTVSRTAKRALARCLLLALITVASALGQGSFKPQDPLTDPGFVAFFNNDYDTAISTFTKQAQAEPTDAGAQNHLAQAILYRQLFLNGALESQLVSGNNPFLRSDKVKISPQDKNRLMSALDKAQRLTDARIAKDGNDVRAYYESGVTHGLRANYFFLVEKAWTESLREATAARKAEERVLELDPKFTDANLILGIYQYVVGSLPFYMRALGFIGGFHGDREEGIRKLELVAREGVVNRYDAQVVLAVLYRREERPRKAIPLLESLAARFPQNNLFAFEQVQMYSDLGDKKSALRVLNDVEAKRKNGAPGYLNLPAAKVQYVMGNLNFWYNDIPAAEANLRVATDGAKQLDLGMALLAWLRFGQVYDMQGRHQQALKAYQSCMATAPDSEVAAEARGYLDKPYKRKRKS